MLRVGDRGVSAWLHDHVQVGDVLTIAPPRIDFPLADDATEHVVKFSGRTKRPEGKIVAGRNRAGIGCFHSKFPAGAVRSVNINPQLVETSAM